MLHARRAQLDLQIRVLARAILNECVRGALLEIVVVAKAVRLETVVADAVRQAVVQPRQA